ncbi:MAG: 50S ribosomal protein L23 [Candidatus Bathyarchaeia archaeon]
MEPHEIILYPSMTEEASRFIETENKLLFIVNRKADKKQIKAAVESLYEVEVEKINTCITPDGLKKAFVKLKPTYKAADVAIKLGIL